MLFTPTIIDLKKRGVAWLDRRDRFSLAMLIVSMVANKDTENYDVNWQEEAKYVITTCSSLPLERDYWNKR